MVVLVNDSFSSVYPVIVVCSLIFNTFVFSWTLFKTLKKSRENRALGFERSLHWYILRDGELQLIRRKMFYVNHFGMEPLLYASART